MKTKFIVLTLVASCFVSMASAQDGKIRGARYDFDEVQNYMANKNRKPEETAEMEKLKVKVRAAIDVALQSPKTKKEFANAYDMLSGLAMFELSPLLDQVIAQQPTDTARLAELLYEALDYKEKAYVAEVEMAPKEYKYVKKNRLDVLKFRNYVAYLGQLFFGNQQYAKATEAFERWMTYPTRYTILNNVEGVTDDPMEPQIAYFLCLSAYFGKDFTTFDKYMPQARTYTDEKDQVTQLILSCYLERGDTASWYAFGKQVVLEDPNANEVVLQNLLANYFQKQNYDEAMAFTEEVLAKDASNKMGNYAKGLVLMNQKKYVEAVKYYDKAVETDPTFSDAYYNAGVCYSNYGYDINEELSTRKLTYQQNQKEVQRVKAEYAKAEPYFLKVQELEPENADKWAGRLATVYYILGNKEKQAEYEKLAGY